MDTPQEHIVADIVDLQQDVQLHIIATERTKIRNKMLILAGIIFVGDFVQLMMTDTVSPLTLGIIAVVPVLVAALAFVAQRQAMLAIIIATLVIVAVLTYSIIATEGRAAWSGLLIKAVMATMIAQCFRHAKEISKAQKQLAITP